MAATVKIFDASLQKEVDYTLSYDRNGEVVARSTESDNQLKFAATSEKELNDQIKAHNDANEGQEVLTADQVAENEKNLDATKELLRSLGASDDELASPESADTDEGKPAPAKPVSDDDRSGQDGQTIVDGRKLDQTVPETDSGAAENTSDTVSSVSPQNN